MKGDTSYWYDFDKFNIDGIAISIVPHAQQGTTFHYKKLALFIYLSQVSYLSAVQIVLPPSPRAASGSEENIAW